MTLTEMDSHFSNTFGISVVKWGAKWCGQCKMLDKVIETLVTKKIIAGVLPVDFDNNIDLASELGISSLPFSRLYVDGKFITNINGVFNEDRLKSLLPSSENIK